MKILFISIWRTLNLIYNNNRKKDNNKNKQRRKIKIGRKTTLLFIQQPFQQEDEE